MGNYKSRPSTSCSETWKNGISENYAVVRRKLNEDLCHLKDPKISKRCEESCCSNQRLLISRDPAAFEAFRNGCLNCDLQLLKALATEDIVNFRLDCDHFTALHYVVINNTCPNKEDQQMAIKLLISKGAKLSNAVTRNLFSPLHLAVFKSDAQIVSCILAESSSIDINFTACEILTPLHLACLHGAEEIVSILLEAGAKPSLLDAVRFSPMHVAIYALNDQTKTASIVKNLASHGAPFCYLKLQPKSKSNGIKDTNLEEPDAEYIPIILLAASRRQIETIAFLLEQPGFDVNTIDLEHNTALHVASKQGHVSVVRMLLQKEDIDLRPNVYGDTAVHLACYAGKIEIVQVLIAKFGKQCLEEVNLFGETPLHASCTFGLNLELIEYLLCENPRLVNYQSKDAGHTPLHSCSYHGHFEAARLLVQNGADVTILASSRDNTLLSRTNGEDSGCGCEDNSIDSSEGNSRGDIFTALYHDTCAQWAAENGHDDLANWLNQCRSNGDSSSYSYRSSGGYTTENSYVPLPSKIGKIKSVTQEKIGVLSLRAQLPKHMQIEYCDIERIEHIGSGGFGKVYKSRLKSKNEIVAVKVYKHHNHNSKTDIDMFVREVKILCQLDNPYIIKFHGVCLDDASNFSLITEFCANGSLYHFIHKQKRCLDLPGKLVILQNVASGMNYLHTLAEPVIHRDLNSFNILLRESMNAVIADFGESRFIDRLLRQEMLTKQPGNLRWMSPEVFNQSTEYNTKADVFNFSLCIWELLSGELPFANLTPLQAAQEMALRGSRPPINESYPESLVQIMTSCWSASPNERPDFGSIVKQLNELLMFNQVNTNLSNLSMSSPTTSFVGRDFSDRISVAELRSNFENTPPVNASESGHSAKPNSGKAAPQLGLPLQSGAADLNCTLTRSGSNSFSESLSENSPVVEFGSSLSQRNSMLDSGPSSNGSTTDVLSQNAVGGQTPFMAMANGYVCDTSQPRLMMAAQRAFNSSLPFSK